MTCIRGYVSLFGVAILSVLSTGCTGLLSQTSGGGTPTYEELANSDDLEQVKSVCNDPSTPAQTRSPACKRAGELMAEEMKTAECSEIDSYWDEASEMGTASTVTRPMHETYGIRLAECDRWEPVFVELMHWGRVNEGAKGTRTLAAISEAGHPVEQAFLAYVSNTPKPLDIEPAPYAVNNYLTWKQNQSGGEPCEAYLPLVKKLGPEASHPVLFYFKEQACKPAAPAAVEALASDSPSTRKLACGLLGKVGDASHLDKVQLLADKDGYSEVYRGATIYPVRDACSQAVTKIQLRQ